jgi:hypothetical protein
MLFLFAVSDSLSGILLDFGKRILMTWISWEYDFFLTEQSVALARTKTNPET